MIIIIIITFTTHAIIHSPG